MSIDFHLQASAPADASQFEATARSMLGELLDCPEGVELAIRSFNPRTHSYGPPGARLDLEPEVSRIWLRDLVAVDVMVIQHGRQSENSEFLIALPTRRSALAVVLAVCTTEALARVVGATTVEDEGLLSHSSGGLVPGRLTELIRDAGNGNVLQQARREYLRANVE